MANYFYNWTPIVVIGTVLILGLPWLGLFALIFVASFVFAALATVALGLAWTIAAVGRAIGREWHRLSGASDGTAPAPRPSVRRPTQLVPLGATVMFAVRALKGDR